MRVLPKTAAEELSQEINQRSTAAVLFLERHGEHLVKFVLLRTVVST